MLDKKSTTDRASPSHHCNTSTTMTSVMIKAPISTLNVPVTL